MVAHWETGVIDTGALAALRPGIVLMDIELPGVDGLECTRRPKGAADTSAIPVVALTAYAMWGDEERARAAGCDGYITKPIDRQILLTELARFLPPTSVPA